MVSTIDSRKEYTNRPLIPVDGLEPISAVTEIAQHEARDLFLDGVAAALKGKRAPAEQLLRASLALDPENHQAWLWLAGVVKDPGQSILCLNRVLELVPDNAHALEGLRWANRRLEEHAGPEPDSSSLSPVRASTEPGQSEIYPASPPVPAMPATRKPGRRWIWISVPAGIAIVLCLVLLLICVASGVSSLILQGVMNAGSEAVGPATKVISPTLGSLPSISPLESRDALVPLSSQSIPAQTVAVVIVGSPEPQSPRPSSLSGNVPVVATSPAVILPSPTPVMSFQPVSAVLAFRPSWYPDASPLSALRVSDWRVPAGVWVRNKTGAARQKSSDHGQYAGKWIEVDISEQTLRAFEDDRLVMETMVSTGEQNTPTVQGKYHILSKYRAVDMSGPGYYVAAVPYAMFFHDGYAIHGAYWHNNFGETTGHGCVNMRPEDAKRLFEWSDPILPEPSPFVLAGQGNKGTLVWIHE